jgi:cytochrome c553
MNVHKNKINLRLLRYAITLAGGAALALATAQTPPPEAATGIDNKTIDTAFVSQADHAEDQDVFEERDGIAQGLGPVYNAQSCAECHQHPVTGGLSQISELRAGHLDSSGNFTAASVTINAHGGSGGFVIANRSLINQRAICPATIVDAFGNTTFDFPNTDTHERVENATNADVRALRTSLNILGDGFVEAIADSTLTGITAAQRNTPAVTVGFPFHPASDFFGHNLSAGENTVVDVLETPGATRVGRFGWKAQLASLLSFSAGAYLNEQGITNRVLPQEVTGNGNLCDTVDDPEDKDNDIDAFARFMRDTKPISRDAAAAATADAKAGSVIFDQIGCAFCHQRSVVTAPAGTRINGGPSDPNSFVIPAALGGKTIHPFSDFAIHNVFPDFIGDGQANGKAISAFKTRTPPLWGLRFRSQMMHDGSAETVIEAILKHENEADFAEANFLSLNSTQTRQLVAFLQSL